LCCKWLQKCESSKWIIHHNKAFAHPTQIVLQLLVKYGIAQVRQPSYLADIATCDLFPFPIFRKMLKVKIFYAAETSEDNRAAVGISKK
jgi:hypothetical protein